MTSTHSVLACLAAVLLLGFEHGHAQEPSKRPPVRSSGGGEVDSNESELSKARAVVIEKLKETRSGAEKLLLLHEAERQRLSDEYEKRRELYSRQLIAHNEVVKAEHELVDAMRRIEADKRWINETETAITEASVRNELLRLPTLASGGYGETATLLRFNGTSFWSVAQSAKIEEFFIRTFGRVLPVSALGQTPTHDRLRFDHREAIDVALHPDSAEGSALLAYLRQAGIPFIGFRSALPGVATGAHIHIGKPSARLKINAQGFHND